jgi:hypothetical protein
MMYLEGSDHNGHILTVPQGQKDTLVFVHIDSCPYCVQAKPVFEEFCRTYSQYGCFMVDMNDDRGRAFIAKQPGLVVDGVPAFLKYREGFLVDRDPRDRTVAGLAAFMAQ